jgi:lysophospholipase L1-like esterase
LALAGASCGRTGGEASPQQKPAPATAPTPTATPTATVTADGRAPAAAVHHVLGTGQSLASGVGGQPVLSTTQPYDNRMFDTGVLAGGMGLTKLVPLVERDVETMSSSFANLVTKLTRDAGGSHDMLFSVHAQGGAPYAAMKKGMPPYAISIAQATAALAIARERGVSYDVTAITSADGGGDHVAKNTHLAADLAEWQHDYETDLKALTGQTTPIPLFNTQYSSWTEYEARSPIPLAQLQAHVENPGKVIVVGPRYAFTYGPDGVHLTNEGYRLMGEYYARAYRRVVVEHGVWEPLRPKTVTRAGAVITVKFLVPTPPLVFDTTLATDPGNLGFEYADDGPTTPAIANVALAGADTVTITLAAEPTAANRRIRYATTGVFRNPAGLKSGARGNLRDSDTTPSAHGYPLFDWCVHFDEAVP